MNELFKIIKRHPNYEIDSRGQVRRVETRQILKPTLSNGHLKVKLDNQTEYVGRLVAETFIDKIQGRTNVRYKDGDKTNTDVSNVEWATHGQTQYDSFGLGINAPGGNMPPKPIKDQKTGTEYPSIKACSRDVGLSPVQIRRLLRKNKRFKLISGRG